MGATPIASPLPIEEVVIVLVTAGNPNPPLAIEEVVVVVVVIAGELSMRATPIALPLAIEEVVVVLVTAGELSVGATTIDFPIIAIEEIVFITGELLVFMGRGINLHDLSCLPTFSVV